MFNTNGGRPHSVIEGDTTSLFPAGANWMNSSTTSSNNTMRRQPAVVGHIGDRGSKLMPERPKSADISNWSLPTTTTSDSLVDHRASNGVFPSVWATQAATQQQSSQQQQQQQSTLDNDLVDFTNSIQQQPFRRRANVNRIPVVPENDELVRSSFLSTNDNSSYRRSSNSNGIEHYSNYILNQPLQGVVDSTANLTLEEHDYASDHSDGSHLSRRRSMTHNNNLNNSMANNSTSRATKDKKAVEVVDMELLKGKKKHCH
jgi:hypothetical protein